MFDLVIFPLSLETGLERFEMPGLLAVSATRKAARMRAQDHLVLYCKLHTIAGGAGGGSSSAQSGNAITQAQLREILTRLTDTYFTFSGSITAGLRVVAARLNDFLLNRNLKAAQEGQTIGTLNMAVIHGDRLVLAHAGATHSFVLARNEVLHFDDGQAGRGLGLSRQMMPRFYQFTLSAGDLLVLCTDPPSGWNEKTLANSPQLSFDHLRRRLTSGAGVDLQAGVIRFQAGKGQITFWRPGETGRTAGKPSGEGRLATRRGLTTAGTAQRQTPASYEQAMEPATTVHETQEATPGPETETEKADQPPVPDNVAHEPDYALSYSSAEQQDIASEPPEESPAATAVEPFAADLETPVNPPGVFLGEAGGEQAGEQGSPLSPRPSPTRPGRMPASNRIAEQPTEAVEGAAGRRIASSGERTHGEVTFGGGALIAGGGDAGARAAARPTRGKRIPVKRSSPRQPGTFQKRLAAFGINARLAIRNAGLFFLKISRGISRALSKIIPRQYDAEGRAIPFFNLSPAQMLAIAVLVPLAVVAVGTTVYARLGLTEQYDQRLKSAQEYAQHASQLTDPVQQREGYKQAYALLQEANKLGVGESEESLALRKHIIGALDELDGNVRLDYQPAISGGLPSNVVISNIVTTLNDVYLLDSSQGRILRLYRSSSGYEVDAKFNCGPGQAGAIIINPLIDLVALPPNNEMHSTVMGIDSGGNLVYCAPNLTGFDSRPLALPDFGWGNIAGITMYGNTLYVMDPKANAVYRYEGTDSEFGEQPHLYFDNTIPQMNDVIDLAVDQEFLYLLHADGRMTICESSGFVFAATKCTDPTPYGDSRPGYEPAPLSFAGTRFTQIQTTQPPDPSLFALDSINKSVYHLSLRRLNLQRQYRAVFDGNFPLPNEPATAFAIAPNRRVLIAFGNKLFFAALP